MMVVDTHALIWWLCGSPSLSRRAARHLRDATPEQPVIASTISILEIVVAARRARLQLAAPVEQWLDDARSLPELRFEPVSERIAQRAGSFGEDMHGDPADRLIAATALTLGAPLITADAKLRSYKALTTLW